MNTSRFIIRDGADYPIPSHRTHRDNPAFFGRRFNGPSEASSQSQSNPVQTTLSTTGATSPATAGNGSPVNAGQIQLSAGGALTTDTSPIVTGQALDTVTQLVKAAIDQVGSTTQSVAGSLQNSIAAGNQQQSNNENLLQAVLSSQAALANNVQSGGQTNNNQTLLTALGIGGAVLLGIFFFNRKH